MTKADLEVLEMECPELARFYKSTTGDREINKFFKEDILDPIAARLLELVKERDKYKNLYEHSKIC